VLTETIPVKGAPDQTIALKFTRHGPVVHEDPARRRAFAVRTVWLEPGSAPYLASLASTQARSPAEFEQAVRHWNVPPGNQLYTDVAGNIAWYASGLAPRRPNHDGLLPVPGDGRYEWDGFHDPSELPRSVNPAAGFLATANEMNLPKDFPSEDVKLGFEWFEYSRADRIKAVLGADAAHTLEASMRLQTDDLSLPAVRVLKLLPQEAAPSPALALLAGWDGHLHEDSAAAALFEVWWTKHLKPALLARAAPDPAVRALMPPGDHESLLAALEQPGLRPWIRDAADRAEFLTGTLLAAYEACVALLGPDPKGWRWGALHHGYFEHPLTAAVPGGGGWHDVGPLPKGGSGSSVMNTRYRPTDYRLVAGASFRMVLDVGNWDGSWFINAPGQSGDPRSPHYDDLAPLWASRRYLPLLYSRDAVDAAAELRITLTPG
jgi:penicillin amidase